MKKVVEDVHEVGGEGGFEGVGLLTSEGGYEGCAEDVDEVGGEGSDDGDFHLFEGFCFLTGRQTNRYL